MAGAELLTKKEVAAFLRVSERTVNRMMLAGRLRFCRMGVIGVVRFKRSDVLSALDRMSSQTPADDAAMG